MGCCLEDDGAVRLRSLFELAVDERLSSLAKLSATVDANHPHLLACLGMDHFHLVLQCREDLCLFLDKLDLVVVGSYVDDVDAVFVA